MDRIDQILRPEAVSAVPDDLRAAYRNLRVLITGAGGSVGSEICRQLALAQVGELVLFGHGENSLVVLDKELSLRYPGLRKTSVVCDVRDRRRVCAVVRYYGPDIVIHTAAHKHVPLMELNPIEAVSNNVLGTLSVASACVKCGIDRMILISTDKAVQPVSWMGATKQLAEKVILREAEIAGGAAFCAIRFANVAWSKGSVLPLFRQQVELGGPVTVTHPLARRYFVTLQEAGTLVLRAASFCVKPQIFALEVGEPILIVELAKRLIGDRGVEMVFTGLRPGERLEEQMWVGEVMPTDDERILEEVVVRIGCAFDGELVRVENAVWCMDVDALAGIVRELVDGFDPGERLYRLGRLD